MKPILEPILVLHCMFLMTEKSGKSDFKSYIAVLNNGSKQVIKTLTNKFGISYFAENFKTYFGRLDFSFSKYGSNTFSMLKN